VSFDWGEYLILAAELPALGTSRASEEARCRAALSRAYYAVYHRALLTAQHRGYSNRRTSSVHRELIQYYGGQPDPRWKQAGIELDRLRTLRSQADYDDQFKDAKNATDAGTQLILQRARRLDAALRRL